jgi:arginyl-tRNA synthetase
MMYACARARSIERNLEQSGISTAKGAFDLVEPAERALALEILAFTAAVRDVETSLEPHRLCTQLYSIAVAYSSFFEKCHIKRAPSDEIRASRLSLSDLTAKVLARGLDLLGIGAPERM